MRAVRRPIALHEFAQPELAVDHVSGRRDFGDIGFDERQQPSALGEGSGCLLAAAQGRGQGARRAKASERRGRGLGLRDARGAQAWIGVIAPGGGGFAVANEMETHAHECAGRNGRAGGIGRMSVMPGSVALRAVAANAVEPDAQRLGAGACR